jgi:phage FluMu gp28-like protein
MSDEQFRCWYEAEFLSLSGSGLFNLREVALCMSGELLKKPEPGYDYYAGLDIARFGDDETALVICRIPVGATVEEQPVELVWYKTRSKKSISDTVGWVLDICQKWGVKYIAVDEVGLGAGAVDFLREKLGDIVYPVSLVGNERRDVYMTLQSMIENRQLVLPKNDELLLRQFSSFKAEYTSDGRIMIKKTKGVRDDVVDALALCCFLMKRKRSAEGHVEYVGDVIQL